MDIKFENDNEIITVEHNLPKTIRNQFFNIIKDIKKFDNIKLEEEFRFYASKIDDAFNSLLDAYDYDNDDEFLKICEKNSSLITWAKKQILDLLYHIEITENILEVALKAKKD